MCFWIWSSLTMISYPASWPSAWNQQIAPVILIQYHFQQFTTFQDLLGGLRCRLRSTQSTSSPQPTRSLAFRFFAGTSRGHRFLQGSSTCWPKWSEPRAAGSQVGSDLPFCPVPLVFSNSYWDLAFWFSHQHEDFTRKYWAKWMKTSAHKIEPGYPVLACSKMFNYDTCHHHPHSSRYCKMSYIPASAMPKHEPRITNIDGMIVGITPDPNGPPRSLGSWDANGSTTWI